MRRDLVLGSGGAPQGGPEGFCPLGAQRMASGAVSLLTVEIFPSFIEQTCVECLLHTRSSARWGYIKSKGESDLG